MSYSELKTGVIGVGSMGQNHARIYNQISNLVGVADPDEKQGRLVANRFSVEWYSDYRDLLENVDAVTIAVPTINHHSVARVVAESGVHMLVEKPLAGNAHDAEKIIQCADSAGVKLAVGHIERHNEVINYSKKAIVNGDWGKIQTMSSKRFSAYPERIRDVGVIFDLAIHDIDVISYISGDSVKTVYVSGGKLKNEKHEDYVNLFLNFSDGKIGLCETNWLTPIKVRELDITTNNCYIKIDYLNQEINVLSSQFEDIDESNLYQTPIKLNKERLVLKGEEPLKNEIVDFLESIVHNRQPLVSGKEGLNAVRIAEAGLKSLESGRVISI